ncbi:MAG: ribonuclease M5 [Peptococcaceae bacterium]|nr:ribonuclease M5 [Peptococcaceae bacterium]
MADTHTKPKIKEVIVVEGKDDVSALRKAVEADILITTGLGLTPKKIEEIKALAERRGVIVFTDPDFPGGKIRHILKDKVPSCKHAYITKEEGRCPKTGKLGVEYASPEAILRALNAAKAEQQQYNIIYDLNDLVQWGLAGLPDSAQRRAALCDRLSIGHCNAKQLVKKLNSYQISREEIEAML